MDIEEITRKVRNIEIKPIGVRREYSVLIPLIEKDGAYYILYEMRSKKMDTQPGEVSFPGGAVEGDESYAEAAVRETMEELNIAEENIDLIGELNHLVSAAGLRIHCFLGLIKNLDPEDIRPNKDEVDHIFLVPLEYFMKTEPDSYTIGFKRYINREFPYELIPNGKEYNWRELKDIVYFYIYGDYVIWGFTAQMTKSFIDVIK